MRAGAERSAPATRPAPPGISLAIFERLLESLPNAGARGRPWADSLRSRLWLTCAALRTNLTFRELAVLFEMPKSRAHRIVADLIPRLAALFHQFRNESRRFSWIVDGTLIPTRDHSTAAKSKNYRYSCNVQVLARKVDLQIVEIAGGGAGNRNDPIHYRDSSVASCCVAHGRVLADGGYRGVPELVIPKFAHNRILRDDAWRRHRRRRARIEHAIARLKDWRILRDHRRRAQWLVSTARAVAVLHNLRSILDAELRDKS